MRARLLISFLLAASLFQADATAAATTDSRANALLDAAVLAHGGEAAIVRASRLELEQRGDYFAREQGLHPEDEVQRVDRTYRWVFDHDAHSVRREAELLYPGGILFSNRTVLTGDHGFSVDLAKWRSGIDLEKADANESIALFAAYERMVPHLLLRQALEARATLRYVDPTAFEYIDASGALVAVGLLEESGLVAGWSSIVNERPQNETSFREYQKVGAVSIPYKVQVKLGPNVQEIVTLRKVRAGRTPRNAFAQPAGYAEPPPHGTPAAVAMVPGLYMLENMPGDYRTLFVEEADHVIVIESPLNAAYAKKQLELIRTVTAKPIRYVLVTHHHGDHTGGLGVLAAEGATLVVPAGASVAIGRQLDRAGVHGAKIEEVADRRTFGSGELQIDVHRIATSHADTNLLMHLPAQKLLFQGDLFYVPERGAVPPAFPVSADLDRAIRQRHLEVARIAGVHGRVATAADMAESLRRGR
jgi:glyoxylase-like metal-dependent hydrolase (beta-lactamase superfamily II)